MRSSTHSIIFNMENTCKTTLVQLFNFRQANLDEQVFSQEITSILGIQKGQQIWFGTRGILSTQCWKGVHMFLPLIASQIFHLSTQSTEQFGWSILFQKQKAFQTIQVYDKAQLPTQNTSASTVHMANWKSRHIVKTALTFIPSELHIYICGTLKQIGKKQSLITHQLYNDP